MLCPCNCVGISSINSAILDNKYRARGQLLWDLKRGWVCECVCSTRAELVRWDIMSCLDAIFVVVICAFTRYICRFFVCLFVGWLVVATWTFSRLLVHDCFSHPGVFEMGLNHFFWCSTITKGYLTLFRPHDCICRKQRTEQRLFKLFTLKFLILNDKTLVFVGKPTHSCLVAFF